MRTFNGQKLILKRKIEGILIKPEKCTIRKPYLQYPNVINSQ